MTAGLPVTAKVSTALKASMPPGDRRSGPRRSRRCGCMLETAKLVHLRSTAPEAGHVRDLVAHLEQERLRAVHAGALGDAFDLVEEVGRGFADHRPEGRRPAARGLRGEAQRRAPWV